MSDKIEDSGDLKIGRETVRLPRWFAVGIITVTALAAGFHAEARLEVRNIGQRQAEYRQEQRENMKEIRRILTSISEGQSLHYQSQHTVTESKVEEIERRLDRLERKL